MAEELLDRVRREIRERRDQARAAYEESNRLQAALAALDAGLAAERRAQRRSADGPPRRRGAGRAPRGQNRAQLLEAIADRPGATAAELAHIAGITRPTTASTLGKLVATGELERVPLPGGRVGFKMANTPSSRKDQESADVVATPHPEESIDAGETAGDLQ